MFVRAVQMPFKSFGWPLRRGSFGKKFFPIIINVHRSYDGMAIYSRLRHHFIQDRKKNLQFPSFRVHQIYHLLRENFQNYAPDIYL